MKKMRFLAAAAAAAVALSLTACSPPADGGGDDDVILIGFATKFPVDFFDIMQDAAEEWDANEPGAEVIFAQGESGTDDEGMIAAIQSFVTQGVDAIAITPTSPALGRRTAEGRRRRDRGHPDRQRHPGLGRQDGGRHDRQLRRWSAGRHVARREPAGGRNARDPAGRAGQPVARRSRRRHARHPR